MPLVPPSQKLNLVEQARQRDLGLIGFADSSAGLQVYAIASGASVLPKVDHFRVVGVGAATVQGAVSINRPGTVSGVTFRSALEVRSAAQFVDCRFEGTVTTLAEAVFTGCQFTSSVPFSNPGLAGDVNAVGCSFTSAPSNITLTACMVL